MATMNSGPNVKVNMILEINMPRPRTRKLLLEHPGYSGLREQRLAFLSHSVCG